MGTKNNTTEIVSKPIEITRIFTASRQSIWNAFTNAEQCKKWWGPRGYSCPTCKMDLRVGGRYHTAMKSDTDGSIFWSTGTYKEIVTEQRLVCTDSFSDTDGNVLNASELGFPGKWPTELLVTTTFEDVGSGKTKMTLRHEGLPSDMYDSCVTGWSESFDKLEETFGSK